MLLSEMRGLLGLSRRASVFSQPASPWLARHMAVESEHSYLVQLHRLHEGDGQLMSTPPAGFVKDPNGADFWMRPDSDVNDNANWWQQPPDGFDYDANPANPHWAFRGDPSDALNWWHDWTPVPTTNALVKGIDVSSAQNTDLRSYIEKVSAQHVVVKLYQRVELPGRGVAISLAQIASAHANGASAGGYVWLYRDVPIQQQVDDALSVADQAGIHLPVLWLDIEGYTDGTCPSAAQVHEALEYGRARGQRVGLYTGLYVWRDRLGQADFSGELLWSASYNFIPNLESAPPYAGMQMVAHQYSSTAPDGSGLDCDVFSAAVCQ